MGGVVNKGKQVSKNSQNTATGDINVQVVCKIGDEPRAYNTKLSSLSPIHLLSQKLEKEVVNVGSTQENHVSVFEIFNSNSVK